jgi:hypothetical protein
MAFNQVTATSLTPSRPAPPIPIRQASTSSSSTAFSSSSSLTLSPPSVSTSSYTSSYSGIGGTPNIGGFPRRSSDDAPMTGIVRQGSVGFKEDAFASWIWREKWLVLREQSLSVHKNEVSFHSSWPLDSRCARSDAKSLSTSFAHHRPRCLDVSRFRSDPPPYQGSH